MDLYSYENALYQYLQNANIQIYIYSVLSLSVLSYNIPLSVVSIKLYKGHTPYVRIL